MGFADAYLQKHALENTFIKQVPSSALKCVIAIPAYKETELSVCLDSLFKSDSLSFHTEVIILINLPRSADKETQGINFNCYKDTLEWIRKHKRPDIKFHVIYADKLPDKYFGAGLARKIVLDESIRRFNSIDHQAGILLSLDADATVKPNYIFAVEEHFRKNSHYSGCSISFEHPKEGTEFKQEVYNSIKKYELHLNYYLRAVRYTGYPYAFHTVGSSFAVKAQIYCRLGGMNKRKAGEDFYFIQKVALYGNFSECNTTKVYPSPRPSNRVPFGTGPEIIKLLNNPGMPYLTFAPQLFEHLRTFYTQLSMLYKNENQKTFLEKLHPLLNDFLKKNNFPIVINEIRQNVASAESFKRRFLLKFNMFWILKYVHYAEENGIEKVDVEKAMKILETYLRET